MKLAYVKYENLTNPNDILTSIRTYVNSLGLTIVADMVDDLDIFDRNISDGKKLVFKDTSGTYYINLRTANGYQIFPEMAGGNANYATSSLPSSTDTKFSGIGMTVSEGYSASARWFDQDKVPTKFQSPVKVGVAIKVAAGTDNFTLYCNHVTTPSETFVFTLYDTVYKSCQHLIFGYISKMDTWTGGAFFSGSYNSYSLSASAYSLVNAINGTMPVMSTSSYGGNTFLRINIDEAPARNNIYWASSGKNNSSDAIQCYTGKQLALPLRYGNALTDSWRPRIPHYGNIQSLSTTDPGVNSNTLNCITVNMPFFMAVKVDPDSLNQYATVGTASGIFFVSVNNMGSGTIYEISYPTSGSTQQVFSMSRRRGAYGFDGISITQ